MGRWWGVAVFAIFDVGLAISLTYLDQRTDKAFMFSMALVVLWILPAMIGLWSLIKFWVCYPLFIKRRLVRVYKSHMHQAEFPSARGHFDHMQFLSSILDSEETTRNARVKAAFLIGEMAVYKTDRPFTMGLAVQHAFEQAMEEYDPVR